MTYLFDALRAAITCKLNELIADGKLVLKSELPSFVVEPPRDQSHGDVATNLAMVLVKATGQKPRVLADILAAAFATIEGVAEISIAGPGFINMRLHQSVWHNELRNILRHGEEWGAQNIGKGQRINVEFVSANPTGPMHAGHVRGAVIGDTLCNLLAKTGYDVTREYYFNDAGAQVDVLARTVHCRYKEALGDEIGDIPEGLYPGEYLREVGSALAERDGDRWRNLPEAEWLAPIRNFAVAKVMEMIQADLELIGIKHDVFTNECDLIANGTLDDAFKFLSDAGLIYTGTLPPPRGKAMEDWEPVPLVLFRSSNFGDSTDRPLKKRDGSWTYLMPDIAYHYDKIRRGFSLMINVLGTDHGGYLDRLRPVVNAFSNGRAKLDVIFNNIVKVFRNGVPIKLSKRSGTLITLREMVENTGRDAVRFFMLTRSPESELEFDFTKVVEQTKDNPCFYVQYAHARCCSVMRHAAAMFASHDFDAKSLAEIEMHALCAPEELGLIRAMASWPRILESAALAREPHRIAFFLMELASVFHSLWNRGNDDADLRFLVADDVIRTRQRLALVMGARVVIASGLRVMGCTPLEEMHNG